MRQFTKNTSNCAPPPAGFNGRSLAAGPGRPNYLHDPADLPLKLIAVTQSVQIVKDLNGATKRQDVMDQSWAALLEACGCLALPVPNQPQSAGRFLDETPVDGILITCGNELTANGGDAPERDRTEFMLVTHAIHNNLPVLGVGRGMQIIQRLFSVPLERVEEHVSPTLEIRINGKTETINSDHRYGAMASVPALKVWARAKDGVVKAIESEKHRLIGIMWRPDRVRPFTASDIDLIRRTFDTNRRAARF